MSRYQIKWKQGDYLKLGKAVSDFNKKVNKLQSEEKKLYLPVELDYKQVKGDITTRNELNSVINSLRRFSREGAEELYITEAGEKMTKWERRELGIKMGVAKRNIQKELVPLETPDSSGYSRAQMGSIEARELRRTLESFSNIEKAVGEGLKGLKKRIRTFGASDYDMKKAMIYKENFFTMLEKTYKNFDNYELLVNYLKQFDNPISFWEFIKDYELLRDIEYMYDFNKHGLRGVSTQTRFNRMLEELGIEIPKNKKEPIHLEEIGRYKKQLGSERDRLQDIGRYKAQLGTEKDRLQDIGRYKNNLGKGKK